MSTRTKFRNGTRASRITWVRRLTVADVAALVIALIALAVSTAAALGVLLMWRRNQRTRSVPTGTEMDSPEDVLGLRREVAGLMQDNVSAFRNLAVVRYDALSELGGHLSWSLALLDQTGSGVVISAIHGRSDTRTYAKSVEGWVSEQELSPEEAEVVRRARPGTNQPDR